MMHAENGPVIDVIAADLVAAGITGPIGHGLARYAILEGEATNRVIRLAEAAGVPVYVVHLSSRDALEAVTAARGRGAMAFAEPARSTSSSRSTTWRTGSRAPSTSAARRSPEDHQVDLWRGPRTDTLQLVATDHCPFDFHGQKDLGEPTSGRSRTGSRPSEDRVDLLHDGGVVKGRISLERWVEIMSTAPARMFGMYPQKGTIAIGSDADILVFDPNRRRTISAATHHMDVDYSIFEGFEIQGTSDVVMSRGTVLVRDGAWVGPASHGRFLRRDVTDFARIS